MIELIELNRSKSALFHDCNIYIVSEDKVEFGDWVYYQTDPEFSGPAVLKLTEDDLDTGGNSVIIKKIVSTTDFKLIRDSQYLGNGGISFISSETMKKLEKKL